MNELDKEFANKLKLENREQFRTLVLMHLSYILNLSTYVNDSEKTKIHKWGKINKKYKGCANSNSPNEHTNFIIEYINQFEQLIDFLLEESNIVQEGIFRRTGSILRQTELKSLILSKALLNLKESNFNVHDCASVFKSFIADLNEPLLTDTYHPVFCQIAEICNSGDCSMETTVMNALQLLILLLPNENYMLFKLTIDMLNKTVGYEYKNKMTADSLATLFTPHLICPRKLPPEALHTSAQSMYKIISFMITHGSSLFEIPSRLAVDIRAYFADQKRVSTKYLDESTTSDSTANTVYTFIDREKTRAAHDTNPTDTALAQLYAHIQTLPESSKKRKLIKQFNKENGHGTPLQYVISNRMKTTSSSAIKTGKSLGDSIKKHIFNKNFISKTPKHLINTPNKDSDGFDTPTRTSQLKPKMRVLFQSPVPPSTSVNNTEIKVNDIGNIINTGRFSISTNEDEPNCDDKHDKKTVLFAEIINKSDNSSSDEEQNDSEECNCSPNSKSRFKSRYKSEPNLSKLSNSSSTHNTPNMKYFANKLIKGVSMSNLRLSMFSTDNKSIGKRRLSVNCNIKSNLIENENRLLMNQEQNTKQNCEFHVDTPKQFMGRNSMSPITKSTQRMPKYMQESIMTPRSRKPVLLGTNINSSDANQSNYYTSCSSLNEEDEDNQLINIERTSISDENLNVHEPESLTSIFRDYLFSRSLLTASPADLSFSSQPDDFGSQSDVRNLSENEMNNSLLYCLDGNKPDDLSFESNSDEVSENNENFDTTNIVSNRKRHVVSCSKNIENCEVTDVDGFQAKKMVLNLELGETSL